MATIVTIGIVGFLAGIVGTLSFIQVLMPPWADETVDGHDAADSAEGFLYAAYVALHTPDKRPAGANRTRTLIDPHRLAQLQRVEHLVEEWMKDVNERERNGR